MVQTITFFLNFLFFALSLALNEKKMLAMLLSSMCNHVVCLCIFLEWELRIIVKTEPKRSAQCYKNLSNAHKTMRNSQTLGFFISPVWNGYKNKIFPLHREQERTFISIWKLKMLRFMVFQFSLTANSQKKLVNGIFFKFYVFSPLKMCAAKIFLWILKL